MARRQLTKSRLVHAALSSGMLNIRASSILTPWLQPVAYRHVLKAVHETRLQAFRITRQFHVLDAWNELFEKDAHLHAREY